MNDLVRFAIAFAQSHSGWAAPIVFSLAFCESFAFVSLFLPTASILFGVGGVIGASGIQFWSVWLSATLGAFTAHWLAYSLAVRFKSHITHLWPLSRNPEIVAGGISFFRRWGHMAVFLGRFFGPLRAVIPLAAGLCEMPWISFQIANLASALVWTAGILLPGVFAVQWLLGK